MEELADKMLEYGGSFAKQIGGAILHADHINLKKLEKAFGKLIKTYRTFL